MEILIIYQGRNGWFLSELCNLSNYVIELGNCNYQLVIGFGFVIVNFQRGNCNGNCNPQNFKSNLNQLSITKNQLQKTKFI